MSLDYPAVSEAEFRNACSKVPCGVTVTTVIGPERTPHGIATSSFTSVSLIPPLVLVCIHHRSQILPHLQPGMPMGINALAEHQRGLSIQFSRDWARRFAEVAWYAGRTGVPLLAGALATFECEITELILAGDHFIVLARVLHVMSNGGSPLTYVNRCYGTIAGEPASAAAVHQISGHAG